jgi:triosephosphate isomerase (TIM)
MKTFIINYKAYKEGIDKGIDIAMASRAIAERLGVEIIVAVPFTLCRGAAKITKAIAQRIDPVDVGAFTGHVSWYEISRSGCVGALINHSENRASFDDTKKSVEFCAGNSLKSYVCVESLEEVRKVLDLSPTAVVYEPRSLIGGDLSVSLAQPGIVRDFVEMVHRRRGVLALIGAGIKDSKDVEKAVELGCDGILAASGVMKAQNYRKKIEELAGALVG